MLSRRYLLLMMGASSSAVAVQAAKYVSVDAEPVPQVQPPLLDTPPEDPAYPVLDWPWSWAGIDVLGYGSSTTAGHSGEPAPLNAARMTTTRDATHYRRSDSAVGAPAPGGSPMFINRGANSGGSLEVTQARLASDQSNGAIPGSRGMLIVQYMDNQVSGSDAASDRATKAVQYVPTYLAVANDPGQARTIFWADKPSTIDPIGSDAHFSGEKFIRRMDAAGRKIIDPKPFFLNYATGVTSDDEKRQKWLMPPSLMADASHTTPAGSELLGRWTLAPWLKTKFNPAWPYLYDRRYWSQEGGNQTNNGKVCELLYEGDFTGVSATVDSPHFKVTIEAGTPVLRRSTSQYLGNLYQNLVVTYWKDVADPADGKLKRFRQRANVIVWLQRPKGLDAGLYKARVGQQVLRGEWRSPDGVQSAESVTFAICIDTEPGWTTILNSLVGGMRLFDSPGLTVRINQGSFGGHVNFSVGSPDAPGVGFNSPPNLFNVDGRRTWLWFWVDFAGGVNNGYGGAYQLEGGSVTAWRGNAFGSVGNNPPATPVRPFKIFTDDGAMTQLFGGNATGAGTAPLARVAVWAARSRIDPVANADRFRDPTTLRSVLNTVRGSDQPGQVGGVDPIFWQEGCAANLTMNLANPLEHWVCSDWAERTAPATLRT